MKYCFYAKKGIDYSKYGFKKDTYRNKIEWVIWRGTRRITIEESKGNYLSFNNVTNEVMKIFMDMVKDNVVIFKEKPDHREPRNHYIGLTQEEYEMIQKKRNEE